MIIGFLGKGGSGKSTLSSNFATYLAAENNCVLAVDADHNMDMAYNLGVSEKHPYIGQGGMQDILEYIGNAANYRDVFIDDTDVAFTLSPQDNVTKKYAREVHPNLFLMVAGPHTENILAGNSCSHTLTTPLKVYLPLLSLKEGEYTVIDERAGVDGVGTGITTGFDLAVIVSEPTLHGLKAAKQIADMLEFYKTPYVFALNKVHDEKEGTEAFEKVFGFSPNFLFPFTKTLGNFGAHLEEREKEEFKKIKEKLHLISNDRRTKTKEKFEKAKNLKS